mmetsp:Transcript_3377/g.6188  ORF Transcript_3377/g.6188 Transcript_3377/m.6188 type:complete len:82 (+) Transcript_3377:202-447(+)
MQIVARLSAVIIDCRIILILMMGCVVVVCFHYHGDDGLGWLMALIGALLAFSDGLIYLMTWKHEVAMDWGTGGGGGKKQIA